MTRVTKKMKLEREDLGRVLCALLRQPDLEPSKVVSSYLDDSGGRIASDVGPLQLAIPQLNPLLVKPGAQVHVGGGGVVLQVCHAEMPEVLYALKVPRPSLFEQATKAAQNYMRARLEYLQHAPIAHPNVAHIAGVGMLSMSIRRVQWTVFPILMEWLDAPRPLTRYLAESCTSPTEVIDIIVDVLDGLEAIHGRDLIHWDIKSDNILVNAAGTPKVTDLGNSRRIGQAGDNKAFSTVWNLPPTLRAACRVDLHRLRGSSRRAILDLPSSDWDSYWLDLWMLARELNRLFNADKAVLEDDRVVRLPKGQKPDAKSFLSRIFEVGDEEASLQRAAIELVLRRLLRPGSPAAPACYPDCASLRAALLRIRDGVLPQVPELQPVPQHVLRLPVTGNVPLSQRVARLYDTPPVKRLARHSQLGSVRHVYPGGTHVRSEHVIGVYAISARFLRALDADAANPFWRVDVTGQDAETLMIAALCHDIGHMAYGHYLEEMEGLFQGRMHEDYAAAAFDASRATPEVVGGRRLARAWREDHEALRKVIREEWAGGDESAASAIMADVAELLQGAAMPNCASDPEAALDPDASTILKNDVLRSILTSAIDADKIDYLLRDSHHCGLHYALGFDADRFFQSLTPMHFLGRLGKESRACVGLDDKGVLTAESLFIARYQLFSCVYWHHSVRAETAMLQYAVQEYVGAPGATVADQLDDLTGVFRERDDADALLWLRARLKNRRFRLHGDRKLLLNICDCLLGEPALRYRRIYESGVSREARNTYEWLQQTMDGFRRSDGPGAYLAAVRHLRESLTTGLATRLGDSGLLKHGEVLVDIPPGGKDQIKNVFVRKGGSIQPIQAVSPIAAAVSDAFAFYARPLRIFVASTALERLTKGGIPEQAIRRAAAQLMRLQEGLFLDEDDGAE